MRSRALIIVFWFNHGRRLVIAPSWCSAASTELIIHRWAVSKGALKSALPVGIAEALVRRGERWVL